MISPLKEAMFYRRLPSGDVRCGLCAHRCLIAADKTGFCRVRQNIGGVLYSLNYGFVSSEAIDPVEKKPLHHFLPGTTTYSLGTFGCNFKCLHCQNHRLSQPGDNIYAAMEKGSGLNRFGEIVTPEEVVNRALLLDSKSISFTYNEPTVWYEFVYDTAVLAKERGLYVILVTNGYMTPEALDFLAPYIDVYRVDLKSFSNDFYENVALARLDPVTASAAQAKKAGLFVETVTLLIPGKNDGTAESEALASFISHNLGNETPVHLTAFRPHFKMNDSPPAAAALLESRRSLFTAAGLLYVYVGNVESDFQNTWCPNCGCLLISRRYHFGENDGLERRGNDFVCVDCGEKIPIFYPFNDGGF
ncbi:MAG: AmmeMemoRadiSam system radical SAM enzyme [Methanimicrococcus sp.]|nr:AmmeMemoRadiSam system radical SAM enzyme [Methanimicrococcus sp.]